MTEEQPNTRLGATVRATGTAFRIWAPKVTTLELVIRDPAARIPMTPEGDGYWSAVVEGCGAGTRYAYLADGQGPFPDPASRSQPEGVHDFSEVVDLTWFAWTDSDWLPLPPREAVIYEMHIGTFTVQGTFASARERLPFLADLGVTTIEIMPLAAFPGRWGWGYDGVSQFAPFPGYGTPEDLCRLVDRAHALGLAVLLDVVVNHFGPDGDYTGVYSDGYRTSLHTTPWGDAINFDDEQSSEVRAFYHQAILMWLHEYHIDGFRFDATHEIRDESRRHILSELAEIARNEGRPGIIPMLIAETHENDARYVRPVAGGGFGFDSTWADDFHHCARTAIVDEHEGYFKSYDGSLETLGRCIEQGFWFEGQLDSFLGTPRGAPARDVPWSSFVYCLQNHDQVGNRAFGVRLSTMASHPDVRAMTTLLLLVPQVPMLFQGQEFFASNPFLYFTDHSEPLGSLVVAGRLREFGAFELFRDEHIRELIPSPQDPRTFERCKLNWDEAEIGAGALSYRFHRELLRLRRNLPVLIRSRESRGLIESDVRGEVLFVTIANDAGRATIVFNHGGPTDVSLGLAGNSEVVMHSEEARFGGSGRKVVIEDGLLSVTGHCAVLLVQPA